jgi:hypothetical protein
MSSSIRILKKLRRESSCWSFFIFLCYASVKTIHGHFQQQFFGETLYETASPNVKVKKSTHIY